MINANYSQFNFCAITYKQSFGSSFNVPKQRPQEPLSNLFFHKFSFITSFCAFDFTRFNSSSAKFNNPNVTYKSIINHVSAYFVDFCRMYLFNNFDKERVSFSLMYFPIILTLTNIIRRHNSKVISVSMSMSVFGFANTIQIASTIQI